MRGKKGNGWPSLTTAMVVNVRSACGTGPEPRNSYRMEIDHAEIRTPRPTDEGPRCFSEEAVKIPPIRWIRRGEQQDGPTILINPNGRQFLPEDSGPARAALLSWLMFVASGVGPYSGQSVHFRLHAPEKIPYAVNRYEFEARRHYTILDTRLAAQRYMLGDTYTIVDMAVWGWARLIPRVLGDEALATMANLQRLVEEISARPAAERAIAMANKHAFKAELDEEARRQMFPGNYPIAELIIFQRQFILF